jgi:CubicO group peptidase (beta-lactamase class C family)
MRALSLLSTWPVSRGAAGVVVGNGGRTPPAVVATTGEVNGVFPWASVTKLCTTLAVLVAVEEGTLGLYDQCGPPGSTVAHLLAHASGMGPDGGVLAPPGTRRIYGNPAFDLLAATLAKRAAMPFGDYLNEAVLVPIGMERAVLPPGGSAAAGMTGSLGDLLALGRQLLAPTVISAETLARATQVAFPGLSGVLPGFGRQEPNDWGLGFELRGTKHPHWTGATNSPATFGHFGQSGAFLWVDPVAQVACASAADRMFGPWAAEAWPQLADAVVAEVSARRVPRPA